jgi:hypothetical protein
VTNAQVSNWSIFSMLCRALAGLDTEALSKFTRLGYLPKIFDMARTQDVLPALAVRCVEQHIDHRHLDEDRSRSLLGALRENTLRNMKISAQALKLTNNLNQAGIIPLFLKGTAKLLQSEEGSLGFRKQIDIDLIVEPEHIQTACEVFLSHGYHFHYDLGNIPDVPYSRDDIDAALAFSQAHHHLPPLVKKNYETTVELHKHFLPKRFQRRVQLAPFFSTAIEHTSHHVKFKVPNVNHQLIHILLGKLVHDGHFAKKTFPIREACDFVELMADCDPSSGLDLVTEYCGNSLSTFRQLVDEIMGAEHRPVFGSRRGVSLRLATMRKRYNSEFLAVLLNTYARSLHLCVSLLHNPEKASAYLRRNYPPS